MKVQTYNLSDLIILHYGKALPRNQRTPNGHVPVMGSNGLLGYHDRPLVSFPTIISGRKGAVGAVTLTVDPCWPIDTTFYVEIKDRSLVDLKYLFY